MPKSRKLPVDNLPVDNFQIQLNTGDNWSPEPADIKKWVDLYPAVDVPQEIRAMIGWIDANPTRRKTPKGIKRFVNSWLARSQDKGGSSGIAKQSKQQAPDSSGRVQVGDRTRDMTTLDDLTHDFADSADYRAHCLETHGQYYKNGVRYTRAV